MSSVVCLMMYAQLREVLCAVMYPIMLSRSESLLCLVLCVVQRVMLSSAVFSGAVFTNVCSVV